MKFYVTLFLSLLFMNFFGATAINNTILLGIIIPFLALNFQKKSIFKWHFVAMFLGIWISILSCYYFRNQPPLLTLKASAPYFYILFYFVLRESNMSIRKMEMLLVVMAILFCISYIIQYIVYPFEIFSGTVNKSIETKEVRFRLAGQALGSLAYFYGINKFLLDKKKMHLMLSAFCFVVIFLMGFRTMIAMILVFTIVIIFRVKGSRLKNVSYIFWIILGLIILLQFPVFKSVVNSMLKRQETEVFTNSEYIRLIQLNYFTQEHFKNLWEYIWGSGLTPFDTKTDYSIYMSKIEDRGIFWVDWGLVGLSWVIGLISVVAMILYSIKTITIKVTTDYYYIGIWFIYLLSLSITTMEFYRAGNFIVQSIALYLVEKVNLACLSDQVTHDR